MATVTFKPFQLPEIKVPNAVPEIPRAVFLERQHKLDKAREAAGLDVIAIYADREHAANMGWLTDFTPRFEEALWVQVARRRPMLLAGNECLSFAMDICKLEADFELYQHFSLPNQDRSRSTDLVALLKKAGLGKGMKVGLIGWKPMDELDVPHWVVRAFESVAGLEPTNAAGLLMNPRDGLRTTLEPEQISFAEYASSLTSEGIKNWVFGLREGISEREAAAHFESYGLELSCHPMVNFAPEIPSGLKSPRNRNAQVGYYAQGAFGLVHSLTCRAGRLVRSDYQEDADGYLEIVENYLQTVRSWYGALAIGKTAGNVVEAATKAKNSAWEFALNPGHLIGLDEWLSSPFAAGSSIPLRSGIAVQQDIIPIPKQGNAAINMEDGFVLAHADLRDQLQRLDPEMMDRIRQRRALMEQLGYNLSEDVLPISNIAGAFFPFLLEPTIIAKFE